MQAAARRDHVVCNHHALALHIVKVLLVNHQRLLGGRGDRFIFHNNRLFHIQLRALARGDIFFAALAAHFVGQRNTLCLCRDNDVKFRQFFQKGKSGSGTDFRTGNGKLYIAEHNESRDVHFFIHWAQRQLPLQARNMKGIGFAHGKTLPFFVE